MITDVYLDLDLKTYTDNIVLLGSALTILSN